MKKKIISILIITLFPCLVFAGPRIQSENYYQQKWCSEHNGEIEYRLPDGTRIDCLLPEHAIEFDFASKWAEAIGQALYYAKETNKKAGIVLIMEKENDWRFVRRLMPIATDLKIDVWLIGPALDNIKNQ